MEKFEKELARLKKSGLMCIKYSDFIRDKSNPCISFLDIDLRCRVAIDDSEPAYAISARIMLAFIQMRDYVNKDIALLRTLEK